jgi:hypothetical protein
VKTKTSSAAASNNKSVGPLRWNASTPFEEYFQMAETLLARAGYSPFCHPRRGMQHDELGDVPDQIERACLLFSDKSNWAVPRPAIRVIGGINSAHNLTVRWRPAVGYRSDRLRERAGPDQFSEEFLRFHISQYGTEYWGWSRPTDELLWVKGWWPYWRGRRLIDDMPFRTDRTDRCLLYAGWAAYETLVKRLSDIVEVSDYTPLAEIIRIPDGVGGRQLGPGTDYLINWGSKQRRRLSQAKTAKDKQAGLGPE